MDEGLATGQTTTAPASTGRAAPAATTVRDLITEGYNATHVEKLMILLGGDLDTGLELSSFLEREDVDEAAKQVRVSGGRGEWPRSCA